MATFRDDLAKVGRRVLEAVEQRAGAEVVRSDDLRVLESERSEARGLRKMLDWVGFSLINHQPMVPGQPGSYDMLPQARRLAVMDCTRAWAEDPQAGQLTDLYVSFTFGRGVPRAQAPDPEVQKHLDDTWDDKANQQILTSFERLVEKGIDLCIQSNILLRVFSGGQDGMARLSLLRFTDIEDVVRHEVDAYRILYYKGVEQRVTYDYQAGRYLTPADARDVIGQPKTVYYEALGAFDDENPVMVAQDEQASGPLRPPEAMLRDGKVIHLAVNKTSEMAFGVPRMKRLMRWLNAYEHTLESHVNRMKAMASIYMKATAKGTQRDLDRLGFKAIGRASTFGAAQDVDDRQPVPAPTGPGILGQNDALNYEAFKIDSGATDVAASAPIIRGQLNGPWPDHYTAGAAAELAGATAMELPVLKFVEREQELWGSPFRALGQESIDAAIRTGWISEWRDPTDAELEQLALAETANEPAPFETNEDGLVKRDLSFEVIMPSPLKRAMGDLVGAAVQTATAVDPNGENPELSRWLFGFILAEAFDVHDPMRIVDEVLPRQREPEPLEQGIDPATGLPVDEIVPGAVGADGQVHTEDNAYGAPAKSPTAEQQAKKVQEAVLELRADGGFDALVELAVAAGSGASSNGNGYHGGS